MYYAMGSQYKEKVSKESKQLTAIGTVRMRTPKTLDDIESLWIV